MWVSNDELEIIIDFLDPFSRREKEPHSFKLDFNLFLFFLEKQQSIQAAKSAKLHTSCYLVALLMATLDFLEATGPKLIEEFIRGNSQISDDDNYE